MRIIVAEDEERSRNGISRLISSIDGAFSVVGQASDGEEALKMIRFYRPDAVLTDILMPNMNGLELIESAQHEGLCPHFAIISAYAEFEYAQQAISLGVCEYIVKPVTYDGVESVMRKLAALPRNLRYSGGRTDVNPLIRSAMTAIAENYRHGISLENLARELKITPEYLSSLFNRETGCNFSLYLQRYRIERAMELLEAGELKMYEVADRTGFSDVKYFSKIFKQISGVSPSQYGKLK